MTFLVAVTRTTEEKSLPAGSAALGSTVVSLLKASDNSVVQTQTVTDGSLITSFAGVVQDDYIVSAQDTDTAGTAIGAAVTQALASSAFDASEPVTIQATSALSVAVSPEDSPAA